VRSRVLPVLEAELGPGVTEALARSAPQFRADADLLDKMAGPASLHAGDGDGGLMADELAILPEAIRSRVLRGAALAAGAPAGALSHHHVTEMDALVTRWHGQHGVDLPGGVRCQRRCGRLLFTTAAGRPTPSARQAGPQRSEEPGGRD
jgi:tRNA(Ile)-lysidine synthase